MSIQEIIQSGANVSITVGTNDLLQFANHLIRSTKEELESTILAKQKETYVKPDEAADNCMWIVPLYGDGLRPAILFL